MAKSSDGHVGHRRALATAALGAVQLPHPQEGTLLVEHPHDAPDDPFSDVQAHPQGRPARNLREFVLEVEAPRVELHRGPGPGGAAGRASVPRGTAEPPYLFGSRFARYSAAGKSEGAADWTILRDSSD